MYINRSDQFDVCERWDVIKVSSEQCRVRMSGRAVWHSSWHLMMGMINGMVSDTFDQCRINFIDGESVALKGLKLNKRSEMTERKLLIENSSPIN